MSTLAFDNDARRLGEDLAWALFASSLPDGEKMAWAALVPYMRIDQLQALSGMLEAGLDRQIERDGDTLRRLRAIMEEHAAKRAELDQKLTAALSAIAKDLRVTATA